jgi:hypothetical protein
MRGSAFAAAAAAMSALDMYAWADPSAGGMSPGQRRFHVCAAQYRRLQAGNQVGKSYAGAAEAWWAMTGTHPLRPAPPRMLGWIVLPDLQGDWPKISSKLRSLQPPGVLAERCHYDPVRGYMSGGQRCIELQSGAIAVPKSGTQDALAVEGGTVDWVWVDEPPKRSHWHALAQRVAVRDGLIWLTFTPIGRPLGWLKEYFDGNRETNPPTPPAPGWIEVRVPLTPENCPHRTPENVRAQIAQMSPWELRQRRDGDWEGLTEARRFVSFAEGAVVTDAFVASLKAEHVRLTWDHGEGTANQIGLLLIGDGRRWVAIDETVSDKGSTPAMDARRALDMLTRWGLTVDHVTAAYGDINSAGKAGSGASVNAMLEAAFADLTRRSAPPFDIQRPNKRAGSVAAGEKALNSLMREGNLFTTARTPVLNRALQHYTGSEQDLKHPVDALRYGLSDILLTPPGSDKLPPTRLLVV